MSEKFKLKIFNVYGVEIKYAVMIVPTKTTRINGESGGYLLCDRTLFSDVEISKYDVTICNSTLYNSVAFLNLVIVKEHMQGGLRIPVRLN